jgi:pilus assembly protein CpaC
MKREFRVRAKVRESLRAAAALSVVAAALVQPAAAQAPDPTAQVREVTADANGYGGELVLASGGSRVLRFDEPVGRVLLGDPDVADVVPLSDRSVYILGRKQGTTSVTVMRAGGKGAPLAAMDVKVGFDIDGLRRNLKEVLPGEPVEVRAGGDGVILSGVLSSSAAAAGAAAVAERYAPTKVVNLTSVKAAEQVMLSVRVAEVQRNALQQLGVTGVSGLWEQGANTLTAAPGAANNEAFANMLLKATVGTVDLNVTIDALERKGVATTLAEPNLVALSGETADFFAGGEFPLPVAQNVSNGQVQTTIQFKPYGVSVAFTPTVVGDTINLAVAPEVSAVDKENAVVAQGFSIPGVTTRRAKTTVELRNGQSFAIAGLIRRDFTDSLRGLPGAARLPVFGALFRSTAWQNRETEVVIIVTARLADPTTADKLKVPTDVTQGPSPTGLWLKARTEQPKPPAKGA